MVSNIYTQVLRGNTKSNWDKEKRGPQKAELSREDNAAMIGCQGYYEWKAGHTAGLELNAYATRDISLG